MIAMSMRYQWLGHPLRTSVCAIAVVALLSMPARSIRAQDGVQEQWADLYAGSNAGYQVNVRALPHDLIVGIAHFEISVAGADGGLDSLEVWLIGRPPEGQAQAARALDTPSRPNVYVANLELEHAGTWEMTVKLTGETGPVDFSFLAEVSRRTRDSSPGGLGTAVWGLMVLAIAGGSAWLYWRSRRAMANGRTA